MERIQEWWLTITPKQRVIGLVVLMGGLLVVGGLLLRQPAKSTGSTEIPAATGSGTMTQSAEIAAGSRRSTSSGGVTQQASSRDTRVFVDVQGAVKQPGLYQFAADMRVADAIKAAGGLAPRADRQQINLAARLTDQQQLYLPIKGEKAPASGNATAAKVGSASSTSGGAGSTATVVNLNTATVADLQQLTGIGEKKAQKIVDYRTEHGSFQTVHDLAQVPGFGEKTVANLQDQLTT